MVIRVPRGPIHREYQVRIRVSGEHQAGVGYELAGEGDGLLAGRCQHAALIAHSDVLRLF